MTGIDKKTGNGLSAEALAHFDASIQADIDGGRIHGCSVIIGRGGKIGHRKTYGTVAPDRATVAEDIFLLMSLSKSLTAALVLRAIDQGRFTLDTRVADILPWFGVGGKQRATIFNLLTHTAGLSSSLAPPPGMTLAETGNLEKFAKAMSAGPAAFYPGSRVSYSPLAGFALLGQIVVATDPKGRSFAAIAQEDLFVPLGMKDTRFGMSQSNSRLVPISWAEKSRHPHMDQVIATLTVPFGEGCEVPGGNAYGTIDDVFRFADALRARGSTGSYRLISQSLLDYARQNHTGDMHSEISDVMAEMSDTPKYPPNYCLMGGYARGRGHYLSPMGLTASPDSFCSVGGASTMWMVDPVRDFVFVFLSAGFIEGLAHLQRLSRLSDLALSACVD